MKVINVALNQIEEDMGQPRYNYNTESLEELADSIEEVGLLNPIKVRIIENGRFKIIFGNRRFKAFKLLGLESIPAIISEKQSDLDIYLEQLTENIQREGFTPIEEAEAFYRLINDEKFKISIKLLSSRLGKTERYIRKKLDLLIFGTNIQQKIHSGTDIIPDKLSEEQVLPLKNVAIEYRDELAAKVAAEQAPVKDVKRISELFLAKDISVESKEILLSRPVHQLLDDWIEYDRIKRKSIPNAEIRVVESSDVEDDNFDVHHTFTEHNQIDIVKKLHSLLNEIPSQHVISQKELSSIEHIKIVNKDEFLSTVDALVDCLLGHAEEWKKVRMKASENRLGVVK